MPLKTHTPAPHAFTHVETWVFDLDNTLYPREINLWQQVDVRIRDYVAQFLKVSTDDAYRIQKDYYLRYGTTMRGMMEEHAMDHQAYLDFVHTIDHSLLEPNPALGHAIAALPGRKLILTNGSREHAIRTAEKLGIHDLFEDVFDIVAADLLPKPYAETYEKFFARHGVDPKGAAMFEDIAHNLEVPHARGMVTTLVVPRSEEEVQREVWEIATGSEPHIDFVTDDLAAFLEAVVVQ